jgi:hypothetical protein
MVYCWCRDLEGFFAWLRSSVSHWAQRIQVAGSTGARDAWMRGPWLGSTHRQELQIDVHAIRVCSMWKKRAHIQKITPLFMWLVWFLGQLYLATMTQGWWFNHLAQKIGGSQVVVDLRIRRRRRKTWDEWRTWKFYEVLRVFGIFWLQKVWNMVMKSVEQEPF